MSDRVRVKSEQGLQGLSIHRPIIYGNTAVVLTPKERESVNPEHTHRWTVAVRSAASAPRSDIIGGADDLSHFIKRVTFKLHESFAMPTRAIDKPPFEVTETGWGEFEIQIRIAFAQDSGEKPITFYHHLKLHPWTLSGDPEIPPLEVAMKVGPVHSWQYDEIVFVEPYQTFLNTLQAHPPTPLPKRKQAPVPFHSSFTTPDSLAASKGGLPEFNGEMEKEEGERLAGARKVVISEQDRYRALLIEREKELAQLQKQVADLG